MAGSGARIGRILAYVNFGISLFFFGIFIEVGELRVEISSGGAGSKWPVYHYFSAGSPFRLSDIECGFILKLFIF
ncbi:hypothetical protein [Pseudoteredinibacter isoporae]|uniref:Uncharacterized protein n=1 Tax=Pseudoteredinibacter isoporae TaxID=570281 RepID=A0A7X0JW48_9GAMM|nr:hypothetical protein [Pseudoteredinibacter isoporae]MBB6523344.1 hypothetical protein [Pseudoteredinibacter isoporae]NHO88857.1 hypothetical protein [Pseudoteredinibacter isoporae]NIB24435.1 hypothetical protein [Pseudoteredinibacter isoporae]